MKKEKIITRFHVWKYYENVNNLHTHKHNTMKYQNNSNIQHFFFVSLNIEGDSCGDYEITFFQSLNYLENFIENIIYK